MVGTSNFNKMFLADLIINQASGIMPDDYEAESHTSLAFGPALSF